jgi:hypothetical protein
LYVEGKATEGTAKIEEGARENEPAKLREFASIVEKITSLREKPRPPMQMAKVPDATADGVVPLEVDLTDDSDVDRTKRVVRPMLAQEIQGGTVIPMAETGAVPCQVGAPIGKTMLCLTAAMGPLVLTDLHAAGECRSELLVVTGAPEAPRWILAAPARAALHITGARLFARAGEAIAIAVPENTRADARCAVTWSGSKP